MTPQQRANLDSAINIAAAAFGISGSETASLPYEKREPYRKELARVILSYPPERFDAQTVENARRELGRGPDAPLETTSILGTLAEFGKEVGNQAVSLGQSVASVGEGVKSTLNLSRWLLPVAAIAGAGVLLLAFARRTGATASPAPRRRRAKPAAA